MPKASTALEQELSDFIDSATKTTKGETVLSHIFSIFPYFLSLFLKQYEQKELCDTELWFAELGRMHVKTSCFFVPLGSFMFS